MQNKLTEEQLARLRQTSAKMAEIEDRTAGLAEHLEAEPVCGPGLHAVYVIPTIKYLFQIYFFFHDQDALVSCKDKFAILEWRAKRFLVVAGLMNDQTELRFEYDTHERVVREFGGSYFNRLR